MATPLEVIRAAQSTTGGSGDRRGPRHSASARRSQVLFISTHLVPFAASPSAFRDPFIRREEAGGGGGPSISQSSGPHRDHHHQRWRGVGTLKPVCVLSSEPWPRPHPRGSDLIGPREGTGRGADSSPGILWCD